MKVKTLIYTSLAASLLLASCNLNEQPVFDDPTQAFIAFSSTSGNLNEAKDGKPDTLLVEIQCASVAGISAKVSVATSVEAYETGAAVAGADYEIISDTELSFDAQNRFATIKIVSVDNDMRDGNRRFDLVLTDVQGCNLGANKTFTVTVVDDEDPMNVLIGTYDAVAQSAFQGAPDEAWTVNISRNDEAENEIFIQPLCLFGGLGAASINSVSATVDVKAGTIYVPLGQNMYGSSYPFADLNGNTAGNLVADFTIDGNNVTIVFRDGFGVPVPDEPGYWYQAIYAPTYTKQ